MGYTLICFGRLQTEMNFSTTEAEHITLSTATRQVLSLRELIL